jgi:hypothetical protein
MVRVLSECSASIRKSHLINNSWVN